MIALEDDSHAQLHFQNWTVRLGPRNDEQGSSACYIRQSRGAITYKIYADVRYNI
jgi:hypothetical protein